MRECEAIETLKNTPLMRYENIYEKNLGHKSQVGTALSMAISSIEEIQQYRAIGTVKEIKTQEESTRRLGEAYLMELATLREYREIGTLEECREAVERMKPKQVIKHKNPMEGCPDMNVCPNCKRIMVRTEIFGRTIDEHCVCCGQAVDFGEE